jgi:hypothetical protein
MSRRSLPIVCLVMSALMYGEVAHAQAVVIQPRVTAGVQDYELNFADVTEGNPNGGLFFRDGFKVRDHLHLLGAGFTVSFGKLFADISGQRTNTGHDLVRQFQGTATDAGTIPAANFGQEHTLDSTFNRKEFNASVGWGVTPEFSAYFGFKHAQLDLSQLLNPLIPPLPVPGDLLFVGPRTIGFSYNGFFVGATYSFPVEALHGAIAVQSSVARLNGVFRESFDGRVFEVQPGNQLQPLDASFRNRAPVYGKSTGLNLGVSWTGNCSWMSEKLAALSYTFGIDRSEYKFNTKETTTGDFEETSTRVRLDLRYRFTIGRE